MNEFVTVSSSSYDPASLATKLTEKSAQGWEVVTIVPTGGDVTAFLSRSASAAASDMAADASPAKGHSSSDAMPAAPAAEPAGWAVAPEPTPQSSAPQTVIASSPMASMDSSSAAHSYQPAAAAAPAATPAVPAGWYADPAGRFDLRYWDGGTWTEHVSRAGQQFTDAPVA